MAASTTTNKSATTVDCYSMFLDAFILNQHIFNDKHFIAPLNRPDHSTFLPGAFSHPDAIPFVDIDGAHPWYKNSRIADVTGTPKSRDNYDNLLREGRLGVYLHWTLPKEFRSSDASADAQVEGKVDHGHVPDRWIVFRCITESSEPDAPALTAFMVESNRIRHFGGHFDPSADESFDVDVEASPFIDSKLPVEKQIDVFMGMKRNFDDGWDDPDPRGRYHTPLTLLDSANPLLADFQHHNAGIFSIHDDVTWADKNGKIVRPKTCSISYAVFGYHAQHDEGKSLCHGSLYSVKWTRDGAPAKSQAKIASDNMSDSQPVALGTDTLEAMETYLHSLVGEEDWVGLIDEMKLAIDQGGHGGLLDSHIPQNLRAGFKPSDGGRCWRFNDDAVAAKKGINGVETKDSPLGDAHIPTAEELILMLNLDRRQAYKEALERQENYLRHHLFCEWWKRRARFEGGKGDNQTCQEESDKRITDDLKALKRVQRLCLKYTQESIEKDAINMHVTARPEFFSRAAPSIIVGGLGTAWPSEFLTDDRCRPRTLQSLPFQGSKGAQDVQKWLKSLIEEEKAPNAPVNPEGICMTHGMKLFFRNPDLVKKILSKHRGNHGLMRLPAIFQSLDDLVALNYNAPGWVRVAVDALMQEWAYALSIGDPESLPSPTPTYYKKLDTHWDDTQPCRALFVEWELEYYHLPKRFWTLERSSDGTADYKISPGINISSFDMMDYHKRTVSGRSVLRPNAEWAMTTLFKQLFDKLDTVSIERKKNLKLAGGRDGVQQQLRDALKDLSLLSGNLDGFTDHLLTLHQGLHVSPYKPDGYDDEKPNSTLDDNLLRALLESEDGHDVTPYGENTYSLDMAEKDFKPVTHGQARFTKFNIVDKFGQVISPIHRPHQSQSFYPCIGRSISCQTNEAEGGNFANGVELDDENCSQFFQLGHRINQDARLNTYFAINSAASESYHESTQYFSGDKGDLRRSGARVEHLWRPATEYEDPVWGWLMLDFRTMGIQVYNAAGESMGEALVPDSIHGKAYWQVYYAEGDQSESADEDSQLQQLIRRMSNAKFLVGLWAMLSEACQNIYHDPLSGDAQMLNMVGRPLALVNIGMNVELATPVMQTQSYQDLLKPDEITLDQYKFEVLLGDRSNLHDGFIGYFPPAAGSVIKDPVAIRMDTTAAVKSKQPDVSCIYTEFGYPGRNIVDYEGNQKQDTFASPSSSQVFLSPLHVDPTAAFNDDPAAYQRAICNHPSTVILGAIIDPYMPVHIATGILPSTTLKLSQWIVDKTLKKLRLLLRGGPVLTRGDLPGIEASADSWKQPPLNQTTAEACVPALTDKGEWSWLQPVVPDYAEPGDDDVFLPRFVPYCLKTAPSDYPLEMGPHTVLEGFYKYGLLEMKDNSTLCAGKPV
ncbi:hypothetical protein BJ170DRAFT_403141 [Xylariales sp. AK1849]|nr:hypothetical protein BJ170DRAFT_403141 [Xylariales sp. AK1849]